MPVGSIPKNRRFGHNPHPVSFCIDSFAANPGPSLCSNCQLRPTGIDRVHQYCTLIPITKDHHWIRMPESIFEATGNKYNIRSHLIDKCGARRALTTKVRCKQNVGFQSGAVFFNKPCFDFASDISGQKGTVIACCNLQNTGTVIIGILQFGFWP